MNNCLTNEQWVSFTRSVVKEIYNNAVYNQWNDYTSSCIFPILVFKEVVYFSKSFEMTKNSGRRIQIRSIIVDISLNNLSLNGNSIFDTMWYYNI